MYGKLIKEGTDWYVETREPSYTEPRLDIRRWKVIDYDRRDWSSTPPPLEDGMEVRYETGWLYWQTYKHGQHGALRCEEEGTYRSEPIPEPKVRRGVATRYSCGRWQKYSKREGWIGA